MTREETLKHFKTWCQQTLGNNCSDKDLHMANNIIALLEPESTEWQHDHEILKAYSDGANEMLDKIRSEVEDINPWTLAFAPSKDHDIRPQIVTNVKNYVLEIIDKYREEREEKE